MSSRAWLRGFRLFGAFLLAPAVMPATLYTSLRVIATRFGPSLSDIAADALRTFVLTFGVGMVYLSVLCLGVPYVLLLRRAERLSFRTVMLPALVLSWVYSVIVYASLQGDYPFAGTIAALCVPGVLLAGLFFYILGVWRSHGDDVQISPLLDAYAGRQEATLEI